MGGTAADAKIIFQKLDLAWTVRLSGDTWLENSDLAEEG